MEFLNNLDDNILLIGEANFSFTISLAEYYLNRDLITTTCYESLNDLKKIFGENLIEENLNLLKKTLNVNKIYFNVDACKLNENLELNTKKYSKIIFMFPHACCKKTNLKLNRQLLERFLLSSKFLLKFNGCVYVTLARGQGGTKFDINLNPNSVKANDNWQLVQIANKCGYLLTECYKFNADLFNYYKSTGYKIQNKSFHIENSLVHKLELSLKIDDNDENFCLNGELINLNGLLKENFMVDNTRILMVKDVSSSNYVNEYFKISVFLNQDNNNTPVLNSLKLNIIKSVKEKFKNVELYDEFLNTHFTTKYETDYKIEDLGFINDLGYNADSNSSYFIRNRLNSDDLLVKLDNGGLNICSALLLEGAETTSNNELNNYKYEMLFYMKSPDIPHDLKSSITDILVKQVNSSSLTSIEESENSLTYSVDSQLLFKVTSTENEFICELNISYLCLLINKLDDKRLIYSNDKRNFHYNDNLMIKPYLIQKESYTHDLCFWYNIHEFNEKKFLNLIRDLTYNQVRYVILIDRNFKKVNLKYKNDFDDDENIYSAFYRFIYETFDKAMDFDTARYIQDSIREQIKLKLNLIPR